ncbi:MAG: hypothetical protein WCE21_04520 [Candidatus Babeliales bacterium]
MITIRTFALYFLLSLSHRALYSAQNNADTYEMNVVSVALCLLNKTPPYVPTPEKLALSYITDNPTLTTSTAIVINNTLKKKDSKRNYRCDFCINTLIQNSNQELSIIRNNRMGAAKFPAVERQMLKAYCFNSKTEFEKHEKTNAHGSTTRIRCSPCKKTFADKHAWHKHIKRFHIID